MTAKLPAMIAVWGSDSNMVTMLCEEGGYYACCKRPADKRAAAAAKPPSG